MWSGHFVHLSIVSIVILWKLEVLRYSSDELRQFRSTNQRRHVVNDAVAKRVDYYVLRVRSTLRRGRRSGLCVKLRRLCGWPTEGWPHPLNDVYAAPVNEQLLIDDSSAAQPIRAADVVTSPLTSPSPSKVNKNNASADATAETAVLCSSFTVPVPHRPQTPSQHIPVLIGRRTPLINSRQREVRKRVLIRVQLKSSTVGLPSSRNVTNSQFNSVLSNCRSVPSLFVLNAAALAKPHAVNQLAVELINYKKV